MEIDMKATEPRYNYLQFVKFKSLSLWDVKRIALSQLEANYPIVKLGEVIKEENKKYRIFEQPNSEFRILGVNNKIGLFDAYIEKGSKINQPYKKVDNGWLAYNPYRINVGSIGYKHSGVTFDYISPAYIVFRCTEKLLPEYLYILFKTDKFSKIIRDNTTGSVRQNLGFDILSNLQIPLPPLNVQNKLVEYFNEKKNLAILKNNNANLLEQNLSTFLAEILGISFKNIEYKKGLSFVQYRAISKWSVDYIQKQESIQTLKKSNYDVVSIGDILEVQQYGISEKCDDNNKHTPVLRMNNIQNGRFDITDLKYYDFKNSKIKKEAVLLNKGDLLFNRTNSKELVGKCAIFDLDGEYSFASYLIRIKLLKVANPYYVNYVVNSKIGRVQIDLMSRQILGQANINSQELKEIILPLPPMQIQNEIVKQLRRKEQEIAKLREDADRLNMLAIEQFQKQIFE